MHAKITHMNFEQLVRLLSWVVLGAIVMLTVVPPAWRPVTGASQMAEHLAAFFLLGGFFALGYRRNLLAVALFVVAGVGLLELCQLFVPGRHARVSDFAFNAIGACAAIAAVWLVAKRSRPDRS
jgi:VanZ like protein